MKNKILYNFLILFGLVLCLPINTKPKLTFDGFFDYTTYPLFTGLAVCNCLISITSTSKYTYSSSLDTNWFVYLSF